MERDEMLRFLERTREEMAFKYAEAQEWITACTLAAPIFYSHMAYECECWEEIGVRADGTPIFDIPNNYSDKCLLAFDDYERAMERLGL